MYPST
ncbi:unnamed protein product [Knipowitschia caucasica]